MQSINPATGEIIRAYRPHTDEEAARRVEKAHACFAKWKTVPFSDRAEKMRAAAAVLRKRKHEFALLMTEEMGKLIGAGEAEIEKCALVCDYYAENAENFLADKPVKTEARQSFITYQPLGVILAIMPWNFPFWQVFRFAAPHLMAGNVGVLKHASNVCGCALAIEEVFREAGFPEGCFTTLLIGGEAAGRLIEHPHIRAVTLTGSNAAGEAVAAKAGKCLKKTVLELGGSDAYVVLADADVGAAAVECAKGRLINAGQSCIAAKRFIVMETLRPEFEKHLLDYFRTIKSGDPKNNQTQLGPLARRDLRDTLHEQVQKSIAKGAQLLLGGAVPSGPGAFYPVTVLSDVRPGMPAFDEELFGPVAAVISAANEDEAFELANASPFGLGGAIFTSDIARAEKLAKTRLDAGQVFVNAFVRSDPRLPFGGIKSSGYGRELSTLGIKEFVNAKTVYIA